MAELQATKPQPQEPPASDAVLAVIERFLDWCHDHRKPDTYEWYRWRLQLFADHVGPSLTVRGLKHFHLDEWLKKHPEWSSGTKHGMARSVMRAMRWAKKKGYIEHNPVADYEKPRPGKRNVVITPEEFDTMLALAGCQEFQDLLVVTWETACRPQESLVVEARHVDLPNARWVFPPDEAKGEQWPRVVYLTEKALAITRRLVALHLAGPLFRNSNGVPWTTDAVNCAFIRLQIRLGTLQIKELKIEVPPVPKADRKTQLAFTPDERKRYRAERKAKLEERRRAVQQLALRHGKKFCLYHLRHSWATHALARGVDALTVAILMGHRDPGTLARTYQHLSQSPEYLRDAAKKAVS
jgi:integrase